MAHLVIYCFFFNDTATTEIYTLSLHDALPIWFQGLFRGYSVLVILTLAAVPVTWFVLAKARFGLRLRAVRSEEHTSELQHANISYAVFCLKKKKMILSRLPTISMERMYFQESG